MYLNLVNPYEAIEPNTTAMIALVNDTTIPFVKPLTTFISEKIKYKQAWLYYLTKQFRSNMSDKSVKELAALDPEKFIKEKKYMFYVLERKEN